MGDAMSLWNRKVEIRVVMRFPTIIKENSPIGYPSMSFSLHMDLWGNIFNLNTCGNISFTRLSFIPLTTLCRIEVSSFSITIFCILICGASSICCIRFRYDITNCRCSETVGRPIRVIFSCPTWCNPKISPSLHCFTV